MILIADSGSTKTDWRAIDKKGKVEQARCAGFNPYYQKEEDIYNELVTILKPQLKGNADKIYFYGAGCSAEDKKNIVSAALAKVFPETQIEINHDLLAAARAVCGKEAGIACILGTGSNSCLYNGEKIVAQVPNLGYMLGDEGSGAILGKKIVAAFLSNELPQHLMDKFEKRYQATRDVVLDHVYKKPFPNRYLAGFSRFLFHNLSDPFIYNLVYHTFEEFYNKHVIKYDNYQNYKVHFVGSIAFYYSNVLRQVANDKGIVVKNIMETPISGLTLYHQKTNF